LYSSSNANHFFSVIWPNLKFFLSISACNQQKMGLPSWQTIKRWLDPRIPIYNPPPRPAASFSRKCPEIPTLENYKITPPSKFWEIFPSRDIPTVPSTPVNVVALQKLLDTHSQTLTEAQSLRGEKLVNELLNGVDSLQITKLQGATIPNSGSVYEHGAVFTDALGSWIKKGFVAGPFFTPPVPDFRANSMMALEQKDKVRIIMNLSKPQGECFNDNVDTSRMEKVRMSTAKEFGYTVIDCGSGARMWKFDMSDAYKNLPARLEDLRLQGFCWLQAYFIETQQAFGASTAVASFDRLGNTILALTLSASGNFTICSTNMLTFNHRSGSKK